MKSSFYKLTAALIACSGAGSRLTAQSQSSNPACQRLETQLATLDRGNADPARADQIRRSEDLVNRQQFEVDRLVAQSRRMGCESSGFFSIFSNPPAQCGPLSRQIDQQRSGLERMRNDLERLNGGTTERAAQRQALLIALGDNGCGPQYRSAALAGQQNGFFDRLFGGNGSGVYSTPPGPDGRHFPHRLRAHVRRFLLSDFVLNVAGSIPRRRTDLPAHVPGVRSVALHLSQSRRGNDAGGFAEWPALHRTANCVSVSKGHER